MADQDAPSFFGENRSLFSDYYLKVRLSALPEWEEDISEPFEQALELYRDKKSVLPGMNEGQTEKEFIRPIFEQVLNHHFDVQRTIDNRGRPNTPDYFFYPNEESLKRAQQKDDDREYQAESLALGDAKRWERRLDGKDVAEKDKYSNVNPSFQIVNYLTATGLEWGILTNGNRWRLYSTKSRSRIDSYFEVDLKRILEEENREQFRYFYYFFRCKAFQKDPQTGYSFTERVFEGSIDYGAQLEDKLKDLIFDQIFLKLARGFVEYRKNEKGIEEETPESLQQIYKATLRLLYRLLFLLHAESRQLLPVDEERGYYQRSLQKLKRDYAEAINENITLSKVSDDTWGDLRALFRIIDKGDPRLNVPRYNGGLFRQDHPENRFLNENGIADYYLIPALELLTRDVDPETGNKRFIDYKSLNVEQLGSIYEGLLEFHLRQADEPLAVVKENGSEVYKPLEEVDNPKETLEEGELYLETDKGERKATGSYYTPHYIVEYIVENTLGPVFEEREAIFEEIMEDWLPKYEEYEKLDQKIADGDRSERIHNKRKELHLETNTLGKRATETLLNLKICDPAMGSGHFLKEATDKLAEKIITLLAEYPINPVTNLLDDIRNQILESLEEQDITIDAEEHLKDTNLIKRMVMKRSIYGVDLNPMAVELAKLSLWLDSFTVGAPLSFLDHHLKVGNSLIGTTVGEVKDELTGDTLTQHGLAGQLFQGGPFVGMLKATGFMHEVAVQTDATMEEIEKSLDSFSEYEDAIAPYKQILDLWISQHFGNEQAQDLVRSYGEDVLDFIKGNRGPENDSQSETFSKANAISNEKSFFHWELEFPEVFVNLKQSKWLDNPGFDAVVGNPPYVRPHKLSSELKNYLWVVFSAFVGKSDLYVCFVQKALRLIKFGGTHSFITSSGWLYLDSFQKLRKEILENGEILKILDLPSNVFKEAAVETVLYVFQKLSENSRKADHNISISNYNIPSKILDKEGERSFSIKQKIFEHTYKNIFDLSLRSYIVNIKNRIEELGINIGKIATLSFGLKTGDDSLFISNEKKNDEYKSLLRGSNIGRYKYKFENEYVWYVPQKMREHRKTARPGEKDRFETDKILIRDTVDKLFGTFDNQNYYVKDVLILRKKASLKFNLKYILALLNSRLIKWYYETSFPTIHVQRDELAYTPIKEVDFSKFDPDKNTQFPEQLEQQYQQFLEGASAVELLDLTEELINDDDEYRLPVIHDFLADLAEKMLEYNNEKQRLEDALDPFKFLNKGVAFNTFSDVFADPIKYGEQFTDGVDIGTVHHDIEELHLKPAHPSDRSERSDGSEKAPWLLSAQLKHRDPDTGWGDWVKEDEHIIRRTTHDIYRFELSDEEARYWQQAFEVLDEFENSGNFPGGKTRSTFEKLMKSEVPVFDDTGKIDDLIELREELAEVEEKIEKTDWLIDQVVYRLYGLSEEEIEVVEGSI